MAGNSNIAAGRCVAGIPAIKGQCPRKITHPGPRISDGCSIPTLPSAGR